MTSRLNQLNDTRLTLPLSYRTTPVGGFVTGTRVTGPHGLTCTLARCVTVTVTLGYGIPSPFMPRTAFEEADDRKPGTPEESEFGQGLYGVLATGGGESTRRQPQRRHGVAIELDEVDHDPDRSRASTHTEAPVRALMRAKAV